MLKLDVERRAEKFVRKLLPKHRRQISGKILDLCSDPVPNDSEQVTGSPYRRVDIGEYRIIYRIEHDTLLIPLIGKRNDDDVYRRLKRLEG